jgi:hypothetical protein
MAVSSPCGRQCSSLRRKGPEISASAMLPAPPSIVSATNPRHPLLARSPQAGKRVVPLAQIGMEKGVCHLTALRIGTDDAQLGGPRRVEPARQRPSSLELDGDPRFVERHVTTPIRYASVKRQHPTLRGYRMLLIIRHTRQDDGHCRVRRDQLRRSPDSRLPR